MKIDAAISPLSPADVPIEQLSGDKRLSDPAKLAEVSRQFEAVLLRQILTEARKTVIHSDKKSESACSGIYQDMVTTQIADTISRSGSFGLAHSLQHQLTRQVLHPSASAPAAAPGAPPAPGSQPKSRHE